MNIIFIRFVGFILPLLLWFQAFQLSGCVTGGTPLMQAVYSGDIQSITRQVDAGEDINQRDSRGYTPLMTATYYNFFSIVEYLLKNGAEINAQGHDGRTALILATCNKNIRLVKLLMRYDPDVTIADDSRRSAADHAANLKLKVISELLGSRQTF
jgi:ankyrin repeat protein